MPTRRWFFAALFSLVLLWAMVLGGALYLQQRLNGGTIAAPLIVPPTPVSTQLPVLWIAPDFSFVDQDGKSFNSNLLRGHVWVADFIFTQCTTACPMMTARMLLLQHEIQNPTVRFVSFSVDPKHDTPTALKAYRELWQGDAKRWTLLATTPDELARVARAMKVTVAAGTTPDNPILHSSLFLLVDADGNVRGIYDSIDTVALEKLKADVRQLNGSDAPALPSAARDRPTSADRGKQLYGAMGCLACHSRSTIAPPLEGLAGGAVRLSDKRVLWADDAYLHESIVNPGAKVVSGYLPTMPPYGTSLSAGQIDDLIAYLHTISKNGDTGHGQMVAASDEPAVELLPDPVCHMKVRAEASTTHVTFQGQTYYFCSDECRDRFLANSAKYVGVSKPGAKYPTSSKSGTAGVP